MTATGALRSLRTNRRKLERRWDARRQNARIVVDSLPLSSLWDGQLHPDLGSGIVLVPFRAQLPSHDALDLGTPRTHRSELPYLFDHPQYGQVNCRKSKNVFVVRDAVPI